MTPLYLDIRENTLALLIQKGNEICYKKHVPYEGSPDDLREKVNQCITESGVKPDTAHIIIPSSEVITENVTLQNMPIEAAGMIIKRKKMTEKGVRSPIIRLSPLKAERMQQTYLVESIEKEVIERYIKYFTPLGIKVRTITTTFQANLMAFKGAEINAGNMGILDVSEDFMEFTIISDSVPVMYERVSLKRTDRDEAPEKSDRITLFKIAERFHNLYRRSKGILVDQPLTKVFISGPLCSSRELISILSEITDVGVLGDTEGWDNCPYTTIEGLIKGVTENSIANFFEGSGWSLDNLIRKYKRFALAAIFAYIALLISGFIYVENKFRYSRLMLDRETRALSQKVFPSDNMTYLKSISEKDIPIYEVMRYLSNNLPEGIFLEKVTYSGKDDKTTMDFIFVIKDVTTIGRDALLTRLSRTFDNSIYLKRHSEPSFFTAGTDKHRMIRVHLTAEVN